ncbi:MAG: phospholipid carrier-dependent glycosyltransferase [Oscillospiraceae bacterium]|jgi:4-amino-4-deoxy-L-arabinose transferase-like glycosyltransferase|nr:phospholipid carrier-dependent glycosyltransferase [Oscillospiraceae bacterium]
MGNLLGNVVYIFPSALVAFILFFFVCFFKSQLPANGTLEWIAFEIEKDKKRELGRFPLAAKDWFLMCAVTLAYAAVAFFYLGDTSAPQTFHVFTPSHGSVTVELPQAQKVNRLMYYTGLNYYPWDKNVYRVELSSDGLSWHEQGASSMPHTYDRTFRWSEARLDNENGAAKYIRITMTDSRGCELGELSVQRWDFSHYLCKACRHRQTVSNDGACEVCGSADREVIGEYTALDASGFTVTGGEDGGRALFDEQDTVPVRRTILNSTHFDEIYHAYTAYEFVQGKAPYETTHPPLGKLITALGVKAFGMTPFGWRFFPALFGVLMLPFLYALIHNMFGKTAVSLAATLVFAFDFMHYVQTRISTIDVYAVFFILGMYFFMYRFLTSNPQSGFWRSCAAPLALCGLMFGLGAASKWVCFYAALGLIALLAWGMARRYNARAAAQMRSGRQIVAVLLWCALFFVVISAAIYIASYIPYITAKGKELTLANLWSECWSNQKHMYSYHSGLTSGHDWGSKWWQWLIDIKPVWYFVSTYTNSADIAMRATVSTFSSPALAWGGLLSLGAAVFLLAYRKIQSSWFILVGYFSQLVPWFAISRTTYAYHYFPSLLFLTLALALVFDMYIEREGARGRRMVVIYTAVCLFLFVMFYPALSGLPVPQWYQAYFLRWFGSWPV